MSAHQNQTNSTVQGTYQYQWGDQVLEIPSNINYQLENVMSGGVSSLRIHINASHKSPRDENERMCTV